MINLLNVILGLLIFTLCYTVLFDFGMFLFITLLLLIVYFLYEMIMDKMEEVRNEFLNIKKELLDKINLIPKNISSLNSLIKS